MLAFIHHTVCIIIISYVFQASAGQKIVVIQGGNIKQEAGVLQPSTPSASGTIATSSILPPVVVSASQDIGMKSIFPTQTSFLAVKKEEKPP